MREALAGAKAAARTWLERRGLRIERVVPWVEPLKEDVGFDTATPLPPDARTVLRRDNPRLLELNARYRAFDSPLNRHTMWQDAYRTAGLDLTHFRGDNIYVWQLR